MSWSPVTALGQKHKPALFCQVRNALLLLSEVHIGGQQRGMPRHDLRDIMKFLARIDHIFQVFLISAHQEATGSCSALLIR